MKNKYIRIILIELLIFLCAMLLINLVNIGEYMPNCLFYEITGLQCHSCGSTRCVLSFLHGDFKNAFLFQPILFIVIIYLLILNILYLINLNRKKKIAKWIYPKPYYAIIFAIIWMSYGMFRNFL